MTRKPATSASEYAERIVRYDRETRDYAAYLDGEYIGSFGSHHEAQVELDRLAGEQLRRAA